MPKNSLTEISTDGNETHDVEQRSTDWFDLRRGRITASMVGAILGHAPFMSREQAMRRMVRDWHSKESEFTGNVATEYGVFNEAGALIEYQLETGEKVDTVGFITHGSIFGASPDGLIGMRKGLEIKCPFGKRKATSPAEFLTLEDQPHYYDQIQFSMLVCGYSEWDFYQWAPSASRLETVRSDQGWIDEHLPTLRQFFSEFKNEREQPLAQRHFDPIKAEINTSEAQKLFDEYDQLCDAIDNAKQKQSEIKLQIIALCKDKSAVVCGRNVTKVNLAGRVAYAKALKEIAPDADLEPFRGKPSTSWRIG